MCANNTAENTTPTPTAVTQHTPLDPPSPPPRSHTTDNQRTHPAPKRMQKTVVTVENPQMCNTIDHD
ncbi:hypothetical protein CAQU_11255 [Corynebacterium aquilae DSM 44791]|uniref:Uncharacterized protein n=1 Tax=Corynebacterium aquilae DSM 44791 TaxID=1431546 RepID=A0A1L7CI41_9CORY|nr:hypothetical protein CAQU_11255 [Corynebacterium aquilae DSM 44791]